VEHAGFYWAGCQVSNFAITLSAGLFVTNKWVIGGANTTSAIILGAILPHANNIETALVIQGLTSFFTAIMFLGEVGRMDLDDYLATKILPLPFMQTTFILRW